MSSASEYNDADPAPSDPGGVRQKPRSRTPLTPRKRRRLESVDPSRIRNYYFEGKYNDAYRLLYNEHVLGAAARFEPLASVQHYTTQIGASTWSSKEQSALFAALERLGKDDAPGIARAIATKSLPETQELLLLLHDAATKQTDARLSLRDVPAAIELGDDCIGQLDILAEALAWYQEMNEASQEQAKYGQHWLITSDVAGQIESALNPDRARAASSVPPSRAETPRKGGNVVIGACASCKRYKQKCDRGTPCSTCVRRKLDECVYPKLPAKADSPRPDPSTEKTKSSQAVNALLQTIPEAQLLNADMMLTLSRTLFMNRSPTVPSPWPHWSEIVSDLTQEPAIYRSAFNDLHALVVSVTKRLMQTAIAQAISRLRSQRQRTKKAVMPLVKRRDVSTASDIIGMKRNGRERWQGVARRCGLRVVQGRRLKREVTWSEFEKIMAPDKLYAEPLATDTEASDGPSTSFKQRAARSGTPLPMDRLALSDSDSESVLNDEYSDGDSDVSMLGNTPQSFARQPTQPRDLHGRYASTAPTPGDGQLDMKHISLEDFDKEASRLEERELRKTLDITAVFEYKRETNTHALNEDDDLGDPEKLMTDPDGWRSWIDYRHEWEEFDDPVPRTKFAANRKPLASAPHDVTIASNKIINPGHDESSSSNDGIAQQRQKPHESVELRTQDPRAYAALQERASRLAGPLENDDDFDDDHSSNTDADRDQPTQSIEDVHDPSLLHNRDDSMDWDAFMD
ncbi:hypothetical protein NX059_003056 [Plenodomus lindquistii]|nr:hypothetical protein NX059_003056 [Plenodomus lindquistii]